MKRRRILALLLSVMMIVTYMPAIAFAETVDAENANDDGTAAVMEEQTEEAQPEEEPETPVDEAVTTEELTEETTEETIEPEAETPVQVRQVPEAGAAKENGLTANQDDLKKDGDGAKDGDGDKFEPPMYMEGALEQTAGVLDGRNGPVYDMLYDTESVAYRISDEVINSDDTVTEIIPFVGLPEDGWKDLGNSCYTYDPDTHTIVLDGKKTGEAIDALYPDPDWLPEQIGISFRGVNAAGEDRWIAGNVIRYRWSYTGYERAFQGDRSVLPGWDGSFDGERMVWVEDKDHPEGENLPVTINDVTVKEGRNLLEEFHDDSDDEGRRWWYYRAGSPGTVTFEITYTDLEGGQQSYEAHLYIGEDVYDCNLWSDGDVKKGLPGAEIGLNAQGGHRFMTDGEDAHEEFTDDNLEYEWIIDRGENIASVERDEENHARAILRFREPEEGEELNGVVRVKVILRDTASDTPSEEKASANMWFDLSSDYYCVWPVGLDPMLVLGQTIEDQKFELRHYHYGGGDGYNSEGYKNVDITGIRWNFDSNAFTITKNGGEQVEDDEWISGTDTFSLTRKGGWNTEVNLTAKFLDEEGKERVEGNSYWFLDRSYNIWFENDHIDVFSDAQEDPQIRINTSDFGSGSEADDNFSFSIEAAEGDAGQWSEVIYPSSVTRDGDFLVATFDRTKLDYENYKDYRVTVQAESRKVEMEPVRREAWIHAKQARYELHMQDHIDMLPGWDRNFEDIEAYIENSEFPDGENFMFPVVNVEVTSGAEHLEEIPTEENEWSFRAGNFGQVSFAVTYLDEHEAEQTINVELNIGGDVYEGWLHAEGPSDHGLPGTSLDLRVEAEHKYVDDRGEQWEDRDLEFHWTIEDGSDFATLTVNEEDPTRATLNFKDMPQDRDWLDEEIRVRVKVTDPHSDDPSEERTSMEECFYVRSDYTEIWPPFYDNVLDLGDTSDDVTFEVRRYSVFGTEEDGYHDGFKTFPVERVQWNYDEEPITIIDADGNPVQSGDRVDGDTFAFIRNKNWDTEPELRVWFINDEGRFDDIDTHFWFSRVEYNQWFDNGEVSVYDDGDWTINIERDESLDYSKVETSVKAGHFEWSDEQQEDVWFDAPEGCWSLSDDGLSVTIHGDKMYAAGIHDMWIYAEAKYGGEFVGESGECHVRLEESCEARGEEHIWLEGPPEYSDCTSPGWKKQMCWNCHEKRIVEVPPRGHVAKQVKAKAATATKEGNVQYWTCSECGKCFSDKACTKEVTKDSRITPKGIIISKLAAVSKGFTVTWKKPASTYLKHTTGYEIQYALDSKFKKSPKTVAVTKNSIVTKKITKLSAQTKYYVRIRTYRTIDGKKVYSPWSTKVKSITTK